MGQGPQERERLVTTETSIGVADLSDYISNWCERNGITWSQLYNRAGLTSASARGLRDKTLVTGPSVDTLKKLAEAMGINYLELMIKAQYIPDYLQDHIDAPDAEIMATFSREILEADEVELLKHYRKLNNDMKQTARNMIKAVK